MWSTQRIRMWWTELCEARNSVSWTSSGKHMSWRAESRVTQSIGYSRSELLCISWQSRGWSSSITISWIGISIVATDRLNTDSNYIAISADWLEDIVHQKLRAEFETKMKQWLAWDKWGGRTLGLLKLECEGSSMTALCSKCYDVDEEDSEKSKFSTKGMSKRQNNITWQRFEGR